MMCSPSQYIQAYVCVCFNFLMCFIYFWLCWVFVAVRAFLVSASQGYPLVVVLGLLIAVATPVAEHIHLPRTSVVAAPGLSSCGALA